ncbi:MAG: hypothetical protein QMC90_01215 [Dehalococcoidales bacterium]|nr:hypothetical protein [Dehalococcoidales bacterium]
MGEQGKLNKVEKSLLESEYRECCEDWRWRDKYVLDKLSAAGILFMLLGVALGTVPPERPLIKLCLLLIGSLFGLILSISVAKDTYYRDGTEKLLRRLSARLGIDSSLQTLKSLEGFDDGLNFQELQFPRKISIQRDKSSLLLPERLRNWLLGQATFRWILAFYLGSLLIFAILFILILVNWIWGLNLPI